MVNPPSTLHCSCTAKLVSLKAEPDKEADGVFEEIQSDWVHFKSVFKDYDSGPPLEIQWSYSRKERTTSNCAGDHRYKKRKNSLQTAGSKECSLYCLPSQAKTESRRPLENIIIELL